MLRALGMGGAFYLRKPTNRHTNHWGPVSFAPRRVCLARVERVCLKPHVLEFRVTEDHAGVRLDKFLRKKLANVPVSHLFKMIRVKKVKVNGKRAQKQLTGATAERAPAPPPPVDLNDLHVLLEDDWILVLDKPPGMAVHTGSGITGGTVVDLVRAYLGPKAVRNDFAASPAHRLDRETSGVLVVAKRRPAMVHFTDVFTHHKAKKRYLVMVKGQLAKTEGLIDLPLSEHQQTAESRERRGVNLQEARTRWKVIAQTSEVAFVSATIETGRTHQIRRHFLAIGHPVAGDRKHGDFAFNREAKAKWGLTRMFLHSERLEFPHPQDEKRTVVESPLPQELVDVLTAAGLRNASPNPHA
ncbi:MAG: rluC [Myxococcaceae bacterium]|nr:rluC [Myxococcaceae bacterium]